jgi:hypothetical protein
MMSDYKEAEWRKMVGYAESNINGDCPLIEDEGVLWASARIAELKKDNDWLFDFALGYTNIEFINESLKTLKEQS